MVPADEGSRLCLQGGFDAVKIQKPSIGVIDDGLVFYVRVIGRSQDDRGLRIGLPSADINTNSVTVLGRLGDHHP